MLRDRLVLPLVAALLAGGATGCSTPSSGHDTLSDGRIRVAALVTDAASALPAPLHASALSTGTATCRRTFLGYAVGSTGRRRAEAPALVQLDSTPNPRSVLDPIEARWRTEGFTIDRRGANDARYPKLQATTTDGYRVTATVILLPPQRLDLYAVSQCLRAG